MQGGGEIPVPVTHKGVLVLSPTIKGNLSPLISSVKVDSPLISMRFCRVLAD